MRTRLLTYVRYIDVAASFYAQLKRGTIVKIFIKIQRFLIKFDLIFAHKHITLHCFICKNNLAFSPKIYL